MSIPGPYEDPKNVISRIISHAKKHLELAENALQSGEYDTLEFCLRVASQDILTLIGYVNKLREMGYIKSVGLGENRV